MAPPLWQQLQACAKALRAVRQGRNHVQALAGVSPAMRPAAQALLFAVLRQWGRTLALQKALVQRAPPAPVDDLLCVGLALAWPHTQAMYPMHTLVNQLVEAAKRDPATRAQAAFINACVRRFDRERTTWVGHTDKQLSARWNHPEWWINTVQQDHPTNWQAVLSASQQAAPMAVRVNRRQHSAEALQALWQSQGVASDRCGPDGLVLHQPQAVHALPGFEQGWFSVQDPGAQMAAPLLLTGLQPSDGPRLRVLDACAAPGGKTAHLLECADIDLLAIDVEEARCQRVRENLQRLQLTAEVRCADAAQPADWWDGQRWDAILLDAPCTASSIVRRHPDIPWLRRHTDIAALAAIQSQMLQALWPTLRRGGRLLYCTCSLFRAEGQGQIQAFLVNNSDAVLKPSPGHLLPGLAASGAAVSDNLPEEHDGFFYALLEKQ
ncbi:MAG: 16S rRNA (cytosine(967)-C(5))-methyltransferase RsmB [Betaproteobacteria bacterium]|nr:16S rRNA (cytosine(967)-C(5))-methyltransferase RsmB [Betaproteobacteria bacterium]